MSIDRWIDNEDIIYTYNIISQIKEWNNAICGNMKGPRECHAEWSKSDREGEISYGIPYLQNVKRNDTSELTYKIKRDS